MTTHLNSKIGYQVLRPLFGTLVFVILYIIATLLYPGGSQADKNAVGFSWINNYWCNLLNEIAINGQHNRARPVALAAMFILCGTLALFWYQFPKYMIFDRGSRVIIQFSGITAMTIAMFLFTDLHDTVINMSGLLGLIALAGTFIGLYKMKQLLLFWFGTLNILLIGLNNYIYYTKGLFVYLPVIQKISFASFLAWICCIDIMIYRKGKDKIFEQT